MIHPSEKKNYLNTLKVVFLGMGFTLLAPCVSFGANEPMILTAPNMLPNGAIDKEYQFKLEATGGTGILTWSQTSGDLPPGLILDSSGLIFGTPTNTVAPNPLPEIQPYTVEIEVMDSAPTTKKAMRTFVLKIYKNAAVEKAAINANCFLKLGESIAIGDTGDNWSVGPTVTTQLFRYNLATEKASFNTPGLGIGAAMRLYMDNDMTAPPGEGDDQKSIRRIKPKCRATTLDTFGDDTGRFKASSVMSFSPVLFASVAEAGSQEFNLQPAFVIGFLRDLINIGVGFNLAGQNQGEVFLLMGLGAGFKF